MYFYYWPASNTELLYISLFKVLICLGPTNLLSHHFGVCVICYRGEQQALSTQLLVQQTIYRG